jgi:carboxymethylenebutenolidase
MAVVNIRGDRLYHEHISWDQATVLQQLDMLPTTVSVTKAKENEPKATLKIPVFGKETAMKLRNKNAVISNGLFANLVS